MDGFVGQAESVRCSDPTSELCGDWPLDVMGYHVQGDIPNYWKYAQQFVLQDRMFEPTKSWSLPAHLFEVSAWSARCTDHNPNSCVSTGQIPAAPTPIFAWTDLTYLLHRQNVSWRYYVVKGTEPDCEDDAKLSCAPVRQLASTPSIWNPLPLFDTVKNNGQVGNVTTIDNFYAAAKAGTLPAVSWISPSWDVSEHPYAGVMAGQSYVTSLVNAVMNSSQWNSSAIFVAWDDWGGFYDHVKPPTVDGAGYGLRVPGFMISPYAKQGFVDHQTLSFDAYLKFIEDDFLGGQRLDPATDGRPDPRPTVREAAPILGDLAAEFDFTKPPRPPLLLAVHPPTTLTPTVPFHLIKPVATPGTKAATLHWAIDPRSGYAGGKPITGYVIRPFRNGTAEAPRTFAGTHLTTTHDVTGLTSGASYTFKIAAVNAVGTGYNSAPTKPVTIS
jgi:phospholipase C